MGDVNGSIFVMQMSNNNTTLSIRAVYDIDFLDVADPAGSTYASVKRFVGSTLTHFYDVLYQGPGSDQSPTSFGPVFACFERSVRKGLHGERCGGHTGQRLQACHGSAVLFHLVA